MLLAGIPFANPEAGRETGTLSTFSDGSTEANLIFPDGGGWDNSTSITVPAGVMITSANVTLEPGSKTATGKFESNATGLASLQDLTNLTLQNDTLMLDHDVWWWEQNTSTGFPGTEMKGINYSSAGLTLEKDYSKSLKAAGTELGICKLDSAQQRPSIAVNSSGALVVVWEDARGSNWDIFAQIISADGKRIGGVIPVCTADDVQAGPVVGIDSNDTIIVAWHDRRSGSYDIYARRIDRDGLKLGQELLVGSGPADQLWPDMAVDSSDNFIITWMQGSGTNWDIYAKRYNKNSTMIGYEIQKIYNTGDQGFPAVAVDKKNDFILAWHTSRDGNPNIYAARYDATGKQIGADWAVTSNPSNQLYPDIAFDSKNDFTIVWTDWRNSGRDIFARMYYSNYTPKGPDFSVCSWPDDQGDLATVCMDSQDNIIVTFATGGDAKWDLYSKRFGPNGKAIGVEFQLSSSPGEQVFQSTVLDRNDNLFVAWQDSRNGGLDIYFRAFGYDLLPSGTVISKNISTPCSTYGTIHADIDLPDGAGYSIDILDPSSGSILQSGLKNCDLVSVGATDHPSIRLRLSISPNDRKESPVVRGWGIGTVLKQTGRQKAGDWTLYNTEVTASVRLSREPGAFCMTAATSAASGPGAQQFPAIAVGEDDRAMIAWEDHRNGPAGEIYVQAISPDGSKPGSEVPVITGPMNAEWPDIAYIQNGRFVLTWQDRRSSVYDIYAQFIDSDGERIGGDFAVTTAPYEQRAPSVASDPFGGFIVAWTDNQNGPTDINAQRFDFDGNKLGPTIAVCTDPGAQHGPDIAMDRTGHFIIAWNDLRSGNGYDIYAQGFDASGNKLGGEIAVSAEPFDQLYPSVAMTSKGGSVICWMDFRSGNGYDVYCKRLDPNGSMSGSEIVVSNASSGQLYPSIAVDPMDRFMITWEDNRNTSTFDIYARFFDTDGTRLGPEIQLTNESANQQGPDISVGASGNFTIAWNDDRASPLDIFTRTLFHPFEQNGSAISPVWNLGHPAKLGGLSFISANPPKSALEVSYRTSTDAISWSPWFPFPGFFKPVLSPADPYIQLRAELHSYAPSSTPAFCFQSLDYALFLGSGTVQPEPIRAPGNISRAVFRIEGPVNNGSFTFLTSTDNMTSWQYSSDNQSVQSINSSKELIYIIRMNASPDGESPVILSISVSYDYDSLPSEVEIDSGNCQVKVRAFRQEVIADISDLFGQWFGNSTNSSGGIVIPLSFHSATAGALRLSDLNITHVPDIGGNRPPVISSPSPPDNSTVNSTDVLLDWSASDPENGSLTFELILNGNILGWNVSRPYLASGLSRGTEYAWQIRANDTHQWADGPVWHFTIAYGAVSNTPPSISLSYPPNKSYVNSNSSALKLEWSGRDIDSDNLTYTLYLDLNNATTVITTTNSSYYTVPGLVTKTVYYWKVVASDGKSSASSPIWYFTFNIVDLADQPPYFENFTLPKAEAGKPFSYRLLARDPESAKITFSLVSGPEGMTIDSGGNLSWTPEKAGTFQFKVNITDGQNTISKTFELVVDAKAKPVPAASFLEGMFPVILILAIVLVVVAAVIVVARRKKPARSQPQNYTQYQGQPPAPPIQAPDPSGISALAQPIVVPSLIPPVPAVPSAPQPVIDDIFLVYKDGRLISHNTRKLKPDSDGSVLASMFTAVQEFVKQSFGDEDSAQINEISYGDNKVLIEHGKTLFIAAVVSGEGTKPMHERMKAAVFNIEQDSAQALAKWSGEAKDLRDSKKWIKALIDGQPIERIQPAPLTPAPASPVATSPAVSTLPPMAPAPAPTPPSAPQHAQMGSLPAPEEMDEEETKPMAKTTPSAQPTFWESQLQTAKKPK